MIFNFSEVVGNSITVSLIKRALANGSFRQVSLFSGPRGTGKSSSANATAMALTCENPVDGLACGECPSCRANRLALAGSGQSSSVRVVNLGLINSTEGIERLVKDVFEFQRSSGRQVFVFEEAHALKSVKNGYTALLSEIDRMSPNTYIIMCTTNPMSLDEALRSRALQFEFKRLSAREALAFAERVAVRVGVRIPTDTLKLVVQYCKGIPREIEKLVSFVAETSVSYGEVQEFLQFVPDESFIEMFRLMESGGVVGAMESLRGVLDSCSVDRVVESFKSFMINAIFYLESGHSESFSQDEKAVLRSALGDGKLSSVVPCVERLSRGCSESDLMMTFLRISSLVQGKRELSIVGQRSTIAAREAKQAARIVENRSNASVSSAGLTRLSTKSLDKFGGVGSSESKG